MQEEILIQVVYEKGGTMWFSCESVIYCGKVK